MQIATKLYISLNIHDRAISIIAGSGDTVGKTELKSTRGQHRECINLANTRATCSYERCAVTDGIIKLIPDPAAAVFRAFQRALNVQVLDQLGTGLTGPEIGFPQQVGNIGRMQGQSILMLGHTGTVLNHPGNRLVRTVQQLLLAHQAGDKLGI